MGFADDRAPHRHSLALAAGKRPRLSLEELFDLEGRRSVLDPPRDLLLRQLAELQPEREVLLDRHVRIQRVVLEDHRDVSLFRREVVHDLVVDAELSVRDLLEARNHPQSGRLAAARRADHHHQLAVVDRQIEVEDGLRAVVEDLRDLVEFDRRQRGTPWCPSELTPFAQAASVWTGERRMARPWHALPARRSGSIRRACRCEARVPARHRRIRSAPLPRYRSARRASLRRRRDLASVVLAEVDLASDSLPGQLKPHERDLSRPFSGRARSAFSAQARDDTANRAASRFRSWVDRIASTPRSRSRLTEASSALCRDVEDPQPQPSTRPASAAAARRGCDRERGEGAVPGILPRTLCSAVEAVKSRLAQSNRPREP